MTTYRVFYPFQDRESSCFIDAETPDDAIEKLHRQYPQIKSILRAVQVEAPTKRRSGYITSDRITWDADGCLARTFGFWAKHIHFYIDVPPAKQAAFEKRYKSIGGEVPEPEIGVYNISLDEQKWSIEAEITFPCTMSLPDDLAKQQTACPGKIARIQLFWALVEHGFKLSRIQNIERIRQFVPNNQVAFFDQGLIGENQ